MAVYRSTAVIAHPSLGGNGTNTWHIRTDGIDDDGDNTIQDLTDALEAFYNGCNDVLAGGTLVTHDGTWIRIDDESDTIVDVTGFSSASGTSTAPLPPANCLVVGWRTSVANRRARGRSFIGPLGVNTLQDNGTPTEASRTALEGHAATFISTFEGLADGAFGVWSVADSLLRDFTSANVSNEFAVLRSRRD